jgi:hypothetical protein
MLGNHCIARGAVIFVKNNTEAQEISEPLCFRLLLAKPDSYISHLTSDIRLRPLAKPDSYISHLTSDIRLRPLAKPDSYFLPLTSYLSPLTCQNGPRPMQLVVVMAVRKAVRAATTTFTATSMKRFFMILNA